MVKDGNRNPAIDGMRGFGSIYVLFHHYVDTANTSNFAFPISNSILSNPIFHEGRCTVQLFFCISGFLIYSTLRHRMGVERHPYICFYIRRFFRIIPIWWLLLFLLYGLGHFGSHVLFANMFFYFGFLSFQPEYLPVIPAWSLFVEEIFYIFFPSMFFWLLKVRNVLIGLAVTCVTAALWLGLGVEFGLPYNYVLLSPGTNFQYFFIGVLFFHLLSDPSQGIEGRYKIGRFVITPNMLDGALLAIVVALAFEIRTPHEISVPVIFLASVSSHTRLHRLLDNALLQRIGVRCYATYIFHTSILYSNWFVGLNYSPKFGGQPFEIKLLTMFPLFVVVVLLASELSFFFIEKPFQRLAEFIIARRFA